MAAPFHRGGAATWRNNPLTATELTEKQGWEVQRLLGAIAVPLGPGHTAHMQAYIKTRTHTHKDIHAEECMAMSRSATFSAFPLTLRGCLGAGRLWAEWGEAVRGSLSPQATPPQSHQVSRFELAFKAHISPSPRSLPAIGTISPTPAFTTKSPLRLLQWNCLQAWGHLDQGFLKRHSPFCKETLSRKPMYKQQQVNFLR